MSAKILVFAGSAREESLNKKLARACVRHIESEAAEATFIDLRDYPMPIYDGDLQEQSGIPENAMKIRELLRDHEGFLIACPEYNSSITPLLKNTIDWVSREGGIAEAFRGKVGAVVSAAPGRLGGLRGLAVVRPILVNLGVHVIPNQVAVNNAKEAFDADGNVIAEPQNEMLQTLVKVLVETATKLNS